MGIISILTQQYYTIITSIVHRRTLKLRGDITYCCCSVAKSCLTLSDPWTEAHQAPLSFTISWSLLKFMSIESVILSKQLIFWRRKRQTHSSILVWRTPWTVTSLARVKHLASCHTDM